MAKSRQKIYTFANPSQIFIPASPTSPDIVEFNAIDRDQMLDLCARYGDEDILGLLRLVRQQGSAANAESRSKRKPKEDAAPGDESEESPPPPAASDES